MWDAKNGFRCLIARDLLCWQACWERLRELPVLGADTSGALKGGKQDAAPPPGIMDF